MMLYWPPDVTKLLSEPMLIYYQLDTQEHVFVLNH